MPTPRGFGFGSFGERPRRGPGRGGCHAQSTGSSRTPAAPRKRPPVSQPAPPPVIEPLPGTAGTAPAGTAVMPDSVHWVRNSAEYEAAVLQAYRLATERLDKLRAGRASGAWAVVADADETLLSNSQYQKERAAAGAGFSAESLVGMGRAAQGARAAGRRRLQQARPATSAAGSSWSRTATRAIARPQRPTCAPTASR